MVESYAAAVEAINPLREARVARLVGRVPASPQTLHRLADYDPVALATALTGFLADSETVYFSALRRYLALIDIEQGDGTEADLWHVRVGAGWGHWFEPRHMARALGAIRAVRGAPAPTSDRGDDWRAAVAQLTAAGRRLAAASADPTVSDALGRLLGGLIADRQWLAQDLGVAAGEVDALADFVAFWRLHDARRDIGLLTYELRAYGTDDANLRRAYYAGIVGMLCGVTVPEAGYLAAIEQPFASGRRLRAEMLAAMAAESLRIRLGSVWWRAAGSVTLLRELGAANSPGDAAGILGYDDLDWRPVLRQIRTQLIGEMSGYGGPNITTRAGTRKV
jgi:hypothetical protein